VPSPFSNPSLVRFLSKEARSKIEAAVKQDPLVIFMKGTPDAPMCGFSRAVCQVMEVQGVKKDKMKTYNCLADEELRQGIKEYSEWPTIPQVYLNGEFIGGCDIMLSSKYPHLSAWQKKLRAGLTWFRFTVHQSGELESTLDKAGVLHPVQAQPQQSSA
jgi:monothiol glutaredoxin